MKPAYFLDAEIEWIIPRNLRAFQAINITTYPTKQVIGLIAQIEQGNFPVLEIWEHPYEGYYVTKKALRVWEAYLRCHLSRVPCTLVERPADSD